jgi:hypothetical protein
MRAAACVCVAALLAVTAPTPALAQEPPAGNVVRAPQPIPRGYHHAPEGTSLRSMIGTVSTTLADADAWQIFYDGASGHPYYFNTVR